MQVVPGSWQQDSSLTSQAAKIYQKRISKRVEVLCMRFMHNELHMVLKLFLQEHRSSQRCLIQFKHFFLQQSHYQVSQKKLAIKQRII